MWEGSAIWAGAFLIAVLTAIVLLRQLGQRYVSTLERRLLASEDEQRLAIQEHGAAVALTEATAEMRAELERARLSRQAAEERAAEQVASDPDVITSRRDGELQVIAARTEARVQWAHEHGAEDDDAAKIDALMVGYRAYLGNTTATFDYWFGNANISGLSLAAIERLIEGYITYLENTTATFEYWFKRANPRLFQ